MVGDGLHLATVAEPPPALRHERALRPARAVRPALSAARDDRRRCRTGSPEPGLDGGVEMNVLIVVATRHGSTLELAQESGIGLAHAGLTAEIRGPEELDRIDDVDGVVVGSAVYAGQWLGAAKSFVERFAPELRQLPVWLFSSGPLGDPPMPAEDPAGVAPLVALIEPREHRVFAGRLARSELGLVEKVVVAAVHAPDGDFRDRAAARGWGREIAAALHAPLAVPG